MVRLDGTWIILPVDRKSILLLEERVEVRMAETFEDKTSDHPAGFPGSWFWMVGETVLSSMRYQGTLPGHFCEGPLACPPLRSHVHGVPLLVCMQSGVQRTAEDLKTNTN